MVKVVRCPRIGYELFYDDVVGLPLPGLPTKTERKYKKEKKNKIEIDDVKPIEKRKLTIGKIL